MDGETDNDAKHAGGGEEDGPADEAGGAEEEAEHGVEDEHAAEETLPLGEPFFGVGEEVGDEGERRDHDEDGDETLAETDGDETDGNRDESAEKGENEHPENGTEAASGADGETTDADAGDDAGGDVGPRDLVEVDGGAGEDFGLDGFEEVDEAAADDVADIDKKGADDEAEVNNNYGNNEAREDAFNAVIIDAETGELGVDDDDDENDENDVGEVAHVLPDAVDGGGSIGGDGFDFELFADEAVEGVNDDGDGVGEGADDPREGAGLGLAGVGGVGGVGAVGGAVGGVFGGAFGGVRVGGAVGRLSGGGVVDGDGVNGEARGKGSRKKHTQDESETKAEFLKSVFEHNWKIVYITNQDPWGWAWCHYITHKQNSQYLMGAGW